MNLFVIQRNDCKFVAIPGSDKTYTVYLQNAWTFASRERAQRECCVENEKVMAVSDLLFAPQEDVGRADEGGSP